MNKEEKTRFPESRFGERYVSVRAILKTWTEVTDVIEFDTFTNQFLIPSGYQIDTKVISWEYL